MPAGRDSCERRRLFVSAALAAAVALFALPGPAASQGTADSASVQAFYQRWFGSLAQGPERYASFYAEDGTALPPSLPPVRGRAAIADWMRTSQASATHTTRLTGLTIDEVRFLSQSLVIQRTTLSGERTPRAGGPAVPFRTQYLDVLRRLGDGGWEVLYRMWNDVTSGK